MWFDGLRGDPHRVPAAVVLVLCAADVLSGADVRGAVDGVVVEDGDGGGREGARLGAGGLAARPVTVVQAGALEGACEGDSIDFYHFGCISGAKLG